MKSLTIENKHTGESLTLRRVKNPSGVEELHLSGTLPPHRQGPPLHIHFEEEEYGNVISGTLSALLDGKKISVDAGGHARFPKGISHRWWNDGDKELVFQGVATPAVDLDRYLQALFQVVNSGYPNRPPIFYMAHVLHRHRQTQLALIMPSMFQYVLFPIIVFLGKLLGKYQGTAWLRHNFCNDD